MRRPMPRVLASRVVLGQILANLLSNAAKFTLRGRAARIRAWAEPRSAGRVRLWVEDEGIGLAPEHRSRIFNVALVGFRGGEVGTGSRGKGGLVRERERG